MTPETIEKAQRHVSALDESPQIAINYWRARNLARALRSSPDKRHQLQARADGEQIIQDPRMIEAMRAIADVLLQRGEVTPDECQSIFERFGVPDEFTVAAPEQNPHGPCAEEAGEG